MQDDSTEQEWPAYIAPRSARNAQAQPIEAMSVRLCVDEYRNVLGALGRVWSGYYLSQHFIIAQSFLPASFFGTHI